MKIKNNTQSTSDRTVDQKQSEKKRSYVSPRIEVQLIMMEEGIAAGSAELKVTNDGTPQVEDWQWGGTRGENNWDM